MSEPTIAELRERLDSLAERYRELRPAADDAWRALEAAEAAEGEARREARTRHALGELTDEELRGEERAITDRLDGLRAEAERLEDAADGVGEKAEAAGDALADAIEQDAASPVRTIDARIAALEAQLAAARAEREAPFGAYRQAREEASRIRDDSKVRPHTRWHVEERRRRQREAAAWGERHRRTVELMDSIGANRGFPREGV